MFCVSQWIVHLACFGLGLCFGSGFWLLLLLVPTSTLLGGVGTLEWVRIVLVIDSFWGMIECLRWAVDKIALKQ